MNKCLIMFWKRCWIQRTEGAKAFLSRLFWIYQHIATAFLEKRDCGGPTPLLLLVKEFASLPFPWFRVHTVHTQWVNQNSLNINWLLWLAVKNTHFPADSHFIYLQCMSPHFLNVSLKCLIAGRLETSEEINKREVGSSGGIENMLWNRRYYCYEALCVHKSGAYGRANVSDAKLLLSGKICSKYLFGTLSEKLLCKTNKQRVLIKGGLEKFPKIN